MLYDSLEYFIKAIRVFKEKHPTTAIVIRDDYKNLRIGFEAILDKDVGDDTATEWTLPLSKFKAEATNVLTVNEYEAIKKFMALRTEYNKAQEDYLNAFTGVKFDTKGEMNAQDVRDALAKLAQYAKILDPK